MIFERERLQVGVEIGPQFEQSLQADLHEEVVGEEIDDAPDNLEPNEREAEEENVAAPIGVLGAEGGIRRQDMVDDEFEGPGLEQIDPDPDQRKKQARDRPPEKRPVITEHAAIDHGEIKIAESGIAIELAARLQGGPEAKSEIQNLKSEFSRCITYLKSGSAGSSTAAIGASSRSWRWKAPSFRSRARS